MKLKINKFSILIFVCSIAVISNQIVLIQYFSYQQWYNFASIIISLALFGFGVSGLIVSNLARGTVEETSKTISLILLISGVYIPLSIFIDKFLIGSFDSYLVFFDLFETLKFFLIVFNYAIPFCLLANLIGLLFTVSSEKIGHLYFFNLFGSGVGGIIAVYLLWIFEPQKIYLINGFIISILGMFFNFSNFKRKSLLSRLLNFLIVIIIFFSLFVPIKNLPSQFKSLSRVKNLPDAKTIFQRNSPYGRIETINSSLLRYSPGLSLNFTQQINPVDAIFVNGELAGFFILQNVNSNFNYLKNSTLNLPFIFKHINRILILNPSGNIEVQRVLINDVDEIFITEKNPVLFKLISSKIGEEEKNRIKLINEDPRIYIENSNLKFDLIFYPVVEPVGYSAGLYSVQEKFLFTKEAFQKIYDRLNENGYFSISCYIDNPVKTFLKLLNMVMEIQKSDGSRLVKQQIIAINNWNVITIVIKKGEFNRTEVLDAEKFSSENQFDFVIHPYKKTTITFNSIIDPQIFKLIEDLKNGQKESLKDYAFNLSPSTDDKPYFSNFIIPKKFKFYLEQMSLRNLTYSEIGYFLIWLALSVGIFFSLILILLVFQTIRINSNKLKFKLLIYFSIIGFSFMLIEISFIQKFTLIFSNDIFSISFILSFLLISSGIGSYISSKNLRYENRYHLVFVLIFLMQILFLVFSNEFVNHTLKFSSFYKYFFSGMIIFPIGLLMGIPFPFGIRQFSTLDENAVPFAWAINGGFSVLGSVSSMILLVNFGFQITFLIAALFYLLLGLFIALKK
ncbi:MAG: hypothetical protein ACPL25_09285 [Ignavibacteria bacterium]